MHDKTRLVGDMRHKGIEIRDNMKPNLPISGVGFFEYWFVVVVCCERLLMLLFITKDFFGQYHNKKEAIPARVPISAIKIIRSIIEMINPVIANPRGLLNIPIKDKRNPRNQIIQPTPGTHDRIREIRAKTNPAVPVPFDCRVGC